MNKHPHYQAIKAYADGCKIEIRLGKWEMIARPEFHEMDEFRIVPDEDGWIPFYAHEDSECPVDPGQIVEAQINRNGKTYGTPTRPAGDIGWSNVTDYPIIRYRISKSPCNSEAESVDTGDDSSFAHKNSKQKHYQVIRAYADNWKIESSDLINSWRQTPNPRFYEDDYHHYRIVPDSEGWIPFYAHEDSECPVDPGQRVEVQHTDNNWMFAGKASEVVWVDDGFHNVTRYRTYKKIVDEYADLKDAHKRGETIQAPFDQGWVDIVGEPCWTLPVEQYRVKSKTKKLYQWVVKDSSMSEKPYYYLTEMFHSTKEELEDSLMSSSSEVIQRIDETMIEVEE